MKSLLVLFNRHFGRASLVAKFSLILNIGLAYSVQGMRTQESQLISDLIKCHSSKYQDLSSMIEKLGLIKESTTNPEIRSQLTEVIQDGLQSLPHHEQPNR